MVDLDRAQPKTLEPRRRAGLAYEPREVVLRRTVAEAPQVDARQDDLTMALLDPARNFAQHGCSAPTPRAAADERDHAEVARERATVLDLHEGADALEARVGANAADRADVAGDERRSLLRPLRDDDHVLGQPRERLAAQTRRAAGQVHPSVVTCRARGRLAALRDRFVRHAA